MTNKLLWLLLSIISFLIMVIVDYILGAQAEFLNAYSLLERIFVIEPTAGDSLVAKQYGVIGELLAVIATNGTVGLILLLCIRGIGR